LFPAVQAALFGAAQRAWESFVPDRTGWDEVIADADVVLHSSLGRVTHDVARSARRARRTTVKLVSSWKSLFVLPRRNVAPGLVVAWNPAMAGAYRRLLRRANGVEVVAGGSMHAAAVFAHRNALSREEFCLAHGLDPERPFVVYTAAAPRAIDREEETVDKVTAELKRRMPEVQVLLRINPMEDGSRFAQIVSEHQTLKMMKPIWEWDQETYWCCPLPKDLDHWAGALRHGACNISVPSTVTLECALFEHPVVNVAFDVSSVVPERSCERYWHAPFYASTRDSGFPCRADNPSDAARAVEQAMTAERADRARLGRRLAEEELWRWRDEDVEALADRVAAVFPRRHRAQ
jgi:hypothetical protein